MNTMSNQLTNLLAQATVILADIDKLQEELHNTVPNPTIYCVYNEIRQLKDKARSVENNLSKLPL